MTCTSDDCSSQTFKISLEKLKISLKSLIEFICFKSKRTVWTFCFKNEMLCVAWYMLLTDRTRESRTPLKLYGWFVTWKDISETISRADFDCQHFNRKVFLMNSFYDKRFLKSPSFLNNSLYVDNLSLNISLKQFQTDDNFNCYNDCGTSIWKGSYSNVDWKRRSPSASFFRDSCMKLI